MYIVVEGTKSFNDYDIFMRAMSVALSSENIDSHIEVWSLGPHTINSYTASFCNSSENFLKQKGFKIKFHKVHASWLEENLDFVNYYAYFSKPNENLSRLAKIAESKNIELGIFRY
ncbi:MAG: hypothetical protein ACO295_05150 [Sediminibacterium sp.]